MNNSPLLQIDRISIGFRASTGQILPVLRDVSLQLSRGQSLGIVGESGSGKSTVVLAAMGFLKHGLQLISGSVSFDGNNMFELSGKELEKLRGGKIALIPQNSGQSLTPSLKIGTQLTEVLKLHTGLSNDQYMDRIIELLGLVRLPDPEAIAKRYPHELSGGQQQRAAIAMALAGDADVLLLDEPTTGLDVTTQAHILELLRDLSIERNMAMAYVSHDLGAIARVCDNVMVMYAGEAILEGSTRQVLTSPFHPYARGLLASIPKLNDPRLPVALDGRPPAPGLAGEGCAFVSRCAIASDRCHREHPEMQATPGGTLRCHHYKDSERISITGTGAQPARAQATDQMSLVLDSLSISYHIPSFFDSLFGAKQEIPNTVDDISVKVTKGETLGLVGESGSGKSTILKTVAGLLPLRSGSVKTGDGKELPPRVEHRESRQLQSIQLIFQNPDESLNPRHTVAQILGQPLGLYFGLRGKEGEARSIEILRRVRLGGHYMDRLPSQLSGGEKQRVAIARAFAANPELVLCDEITSALDVSVQAAVIDLLNELKKEHGTNFIFVSHDLAVVRALSDRVAVLYQGRLCEIGPSDQVYALPSHPYTEVLLGAVLEPDPDVAPKLLAEDVVELSPPARGCPFQRRCPRRLGSVCDNQEPPWQQSEDRHFIRCHIPIEELHGAQVEDAA